MLFFPLKKVFGFFKHFSMIIFVFDFVFSSLYISFCIYLSCHPQFPGSVTWSLSPILKEIISAIITSNIYISFLAFYIPFQLLIYYIFVIALWFLYILLILFFPVSLCDFNQYISRNNDSFLGLARCIREPMENFLSWILLEVWLEVLSPRHSV